MLSHIYVDMHKFIHINLVEYAGHKVYNSPKDDRW